MIVKPLRGIVRRDGSVTQRALADSRRWAGMYEPLRVNCRRSIPGVPFVQFDSVFLAQPAELILVAHFAVVLFLVGDVVF